MPTQEENSACFVLALRRNRGGKGTNIDDLLGPGILGTNAVGLKTVNDAWGSPIIFYRWATANAELDNSGPGPTSVPAVLPARRDTQDEEGKLQDKNWQLVAARPNGREKRKTIAVGKTQVENRCIVMNVGQGLVDVRTGTEGINDEPFPRQRT